ncbi:Protein of unknown function [Pyronema omphalodes CBS 100304]|uniref:Uncharacterized protein n=1 Tax=Pyronema omphalodes (strain CBS 100304) TaxID=1076935 RepID=U4LGQ6_PYROM|nr:Protein of unknown function [Pyronema omphalodes CBS 100304]
MEPVHYRVMSANQPKDFAPSHTIENKVVVHDLPTIYEERTLKGISTIQEETTITEETSVEMT